MINYYHKYRREYLGCGLVTQQLPFKCESRIPVLGTTYMHQHIQAVLLPDITNLISNALEPVLCTY